MICLTISGTDNRMVIGFARRIRRAWNWPSPEMNLTGMRGNSITAGVFDRGAMCKDLERIDYESDNESNHK